MDLEQYIRVDQAIVLALVEANEAGMDLEAFIDAVRLASDEYGTLEH